MGIDLLNRENVREQVMGQMASQIDGVTGRWTLFTKLISKAA